VKTAEERAREIEAVAEDMNLTHDEARAKYALILKEFARDQRHLCAEAAQERLANLPATGLPANHAHAAVMNTPFPGEVKP